MDKQTITRCTKRTRLHAFKSRWCHQCPFLHYLWQQMQADVLPFASTPALERYPSPRAQCVCVCGLRMMPKIHCSELPPKFISASFQVGNLFFRPIEMLRDLWIFRSRANNFCLWRIRFFFRLQSFLSTEECCATCVSRERTAL